MTFLSILSLPLSIAACCYSAYLHGLRRGADEGYRKGYEAGYIDAGVDS